MCYMDKKVGQHRKKYVFNLVDWSVQLHLNEETNYVPFCAPVFRESIVKANVVSSNLDQGEVFNVT
jgi:hypothetical protein